MKRWFISRLVQVEDELQPKVAQYQNVNYRIWTAAGKNWCFGQLATNNVTQFTGDNDIRILPDAALDNLWSSLSSGTRTAVINFLQSAGFTTTHIRNTTPIRQVLQGLKRQLQVDDDIEAGDIQDIE